VIPIADLKLQYQSLKSEIDAAMRAVAESGRYILGPNVAALEGELAHYCDCRHAIGVANGTDALHLALRALQIGPGDEVITSPFTFVATAEAIGLVGATPVFVDIDPLTFNIDPFRIEEAITPRTRAIVPVHLYGQPCEMDSILRIARLHDLKVVEDCAQALGATYRNRKAGGLGDIGCISFFPSKNLGCFGDGGIVLTNDSGVAERVEMLRRHGGRVKYHHDELGLNSRLDELQAAIVRVKLPHLEGWVGRRRHVAARYSAHLRELNGLQLPVEVDETRHAYHQYTVRVPDRERVRRSLLEAGVQTVVYYPIPLHLQRVHAALGHQRGDFPHSESAAKDVLSLPMFPELTDHQVEHVISALHHAVGTAPA